MPNKIKTGAMIEIPVSELKTDYKKLLLSLTVPNPAYKSASFFGKGFVKKGIPKKLFFFRLNEKDKTILVPRGIDRNYFKNGAELNRMSYGTEISEGHTGNFKLRPNQQEFFDGKVYPYIDNKKKNEPIDLLLNAECGSGKTIMALALTSEYRTRTVVAVTTKKIGNQFKKAVKDLFPNWTCDWEDGKNEYDVTLSTYSLLSKENYTEDYFRKFGHIVLDEYHRCGADTYSRILEKATCRYRTSLTATFRRKDGLHKILKLHAGDILEMERSSMKATIYPLSTGYEINEDLFRGVNRFNTKFENLEEYTDIALKNKKGVEVDRGMAIKIDRNKGSFYLMSAVTKKEILIDNPSEYIIKKLGNVSSPMIDTEVADIEARTIDVFELIRELYRQGRKIIVLSRRKDQLYQLGGKLKRRGIDAGVFVSEKDKDYKEYCKRNGRTIEEQRDYVFNRVNIILGIDKLAEEGMDAPSFDTLIYLHPIKDVEQSIGRILREYGGKKDPIAFYLVDKVNSYNKAFYGKTKGARKMFVDLGHKVEEEISMSEATQLIKDNEI